MSLLAIDIAIEDRLRVNKQMQEELEDMESRIMQFLKETDLKIFPATEEVSCQCIPEHFVHPMAMEKHLVTYMNILNELFV